MLLRIHIIDCLCKLLRNVCSVKPNLKNFTPVLLLKLPTNMYFLALPTQQQVLITISRKLPRGSLPATSR